jgi:TonB-linked SusC/RagA family outer membrane protein
MQKTGISQHFLKRRYKLLLHMIKLVTILTFISILTVYGKSYSQKLTINIKNAKITEVFEQIQKKSEYRIFYEEAHIAKINNKALNLNLVQKAVSEILDITLKESGFTYRIIGKQITVFPIPKSATKPTASIRQETPGLLTGKILDEKEEPIPGATVHIIELKRTVLANNNGVYNVSLPAGTYTVEIRYMSFITQIRKEVKITSGKTTTIDIRLQPETKKLNEVIVTALGIEREEKALGYAAQKIDGKEVSDSPTSNWLNALSGKVAGLNLNKIGGPLGTSDVILRGDNVLALGGSGALIVVDGIPISSSQTGTGDGPIIGSDSPVDFGSSLTDLNPEDIENISVLKGPGAAALYGSRASNGAIIITTKSGKKSPGLGIYVSSHFTYYEVNNYPDYQFEYGQGTVGQNWYSYSNSVDGNSTRGTTGAWGPRFLGQPYFQFHSPYDTDTYSNPITAPRTERVPWVANKEAYSGFFKPAITQYNSVAIAGEGFRASAAYHKNEWIIPNTGFERMLLSLSGNRKISSRITLNGKANYTRKFTDNLPSQGYNNQTVMYFMIQQVPNVNIDWYKQRWMPGLENIQEFSPFWSGLDNPYVVAYEMTNASDRHNMIGSLQASMQINNNLDFSLRSGADMSYEFRSQQRPQSTYRWKDGMYRQQNVFRIESNTDFLLKYKNTLPGRIKYTVSVGGNQRYNDYKYDNMMADRLTLPGVYNIANSRDPVVPRSDRQKFMVNSLYGFANFDYRGKVFLELTGRNDWSSTLPIHNSSFFYPSVNTSLLLTEILTLPKWISFAKVRGSFASTGVDSKSPYAFLNNYGQTDFPGSLTTPGTMPNSNLKPQFTDAYETGFDLRLFKNRLSLDVAIYKGSTRNQIINLPVEPSSGYTSAMTNVGKVENKGIEIQLKGTPVQSNSGLKWDVNVNFAANRNKVLDVASALGAESKLNLYQISWANLYLVAEEGKALGQLYGLGFKRSPDGQMIFKNGLPVYTDEIQNWGNTNPDFTASLKNSVSWRGVTASVLLDARVGGKMMSYSHATLSLGGKLTNSLPGRENGIVGKGVVENADGSFSTNTTRVPAALYYAQYYNYTVMESNLFSSSFLKLREVSVSYKVPKKYIKWHAIKSASIALTGRDLLIFSKFPLFDPETATLNSAQVLPGIEIGQFPSTRSFGVSLNIEF